MTTYSAPVEDMMFLFEHLKDNKHYNEIEKYKEVNSELVKDILDEAAKINKDLILPLARGSIKSLLIFAASSKISLTNSELTSLYFSISL